MSMLNMLSDEIRAAAQRLSVTAEGLTEDCWTWSPNASRWSPALVLEHVVLVNRLGARRLRTLSPDSRLSAVTDQEIPYLFYQGDEPTGIADPSGQFPDKAQALSALMAATAELVSAVDPSVDLRAHGARHPLFGAMDGAQWMIFYAAHMDRHRAEIIGLQREHLAAIARQGDRSEAS